MALSSFLKPSYVCGGLGVAATPAIGYGGWALYGAASPTDQSPFDKRGFERSGIAHSSGFLSGWFQEDKSGCFHHFFPGSTGISKAGFDVAHFSSNDPDKLFKSAPTAAPDPSSEPIGCALLQLEFNSTSDFSFRSEVALKRGDMGWILWDRMEPDKDESSPWTWETAVVFLWQKSRDHWSVAGAFHQDSEITEKDPGKINIFANGENWTIPTSDPSFPSVKKYSGIWESTKDAGAEEIFGGFKVNYDNRKWSVLGLQNSSGSGDFSDFEVLTDDLNIYDSALDKWGSYPLIGAKTIQPESIKTRIRRMLRDWHTPFKGIKGRWSDFTKSSLCQESADEPAADGAQLEKLKSFCYRKK